MTAIRHHIPDHMLDAYRAGTLPHAFGVVVAAHLSLCDQCRARHEAVDMIGGAFLLFALFALFAFVFSGLAPQGIPFVH